MRQAIVFLAAALAIVACEAGSTPRAATERQSALEATEAPTDTVALPDVRGMTYDEARYLLTDLGLGVIRLDVPHGQSPVDEVVDQIPRPGGERPPSGRVEL